MSQLGSSSHVLDEPCQVVTVIKMDGSEFEVRGLVLSMFWVIDLKCIIAVQEHIAEDMFDLSVGDVVLKSPELLNLSLKDAGILDTVSLTMKNKDPYCPESNQCTVCKMPHRSWQEEPVCQRCLLEQSDRLQLVFTWVSPS